MKNKVISNYLKLYFDDVLYITEIDKSKLSNFINLRYELQLINIGNKPFILVSDLEKSFNIKNIVSVQRTLNNLYTRGVIFVFDYLDIYKRRILVKNRVSFIVPDAHMYVRSLGLSFNEYFNKEEVSYKKLSLGAQYILIHLLTFDSIPKNLNRISKIVSKSAMSVSRAVKELEYFKLINVKDNRKDKIISFNGSKKIVWDKAKPFLQNPVKEIVYIEPNNSIIENNFILSGISALSSNSNMGSEENIYAIESKDWKEINHKFKMSSKGTGENYAVEVWKSSIPKYKGKMNPLGIYLSLLNNKDERVEKELNILIGRII